MKDVDLVAITLLAVAVIVVVICATDIAASAWEETEMCNILQAAQATDGLSALKSVGYCRGR